MDRKRRLIICALFLMLGITPLLLMSQKLHWQNFLPFLFDVDITRYDQHILEVSRRHALDHRLIKALIRAESRFDPLAVSPRGAMGLMQLMPETARDMGVADPFDPRENIEGGARYLKRLLNRFNNDLTLALAAYNAGPQTVTRYGGVPPYEETRAYLKKVMRFYSDYRNET